MRLSARKFSVLKRIRRRRGSEMFLPVVSTSSSLAEKNRAFAIKVTKEYTRRGLAAGCDFDDLVSAAFFGLVLAERRFKPRLGFSFLTYAVWWIRRELENAVSSGPVVSIPRSTLYQHNRRGKFVEYPRMIREGDTGTSESLFDKCASTEASPLADAMNQERANEIQELISTLPPKHQRVITLRFGFQNNRCHTLNEVGTLMGFSRERIRQLQGEALQLLKARLCSRQRRQSHGSKD